jgi:hypothetical protein
MKIDIILWDHDVLHQIMAVPVSVPGALAINAFIRSIAQEVSLNDDEFVGCAPINIEPAELLAHMPQDLSIVFYRRPDDQIIDVRSLNKNPLQ